MAIKVNGTTVINDSRALTNIASVDATTVAALGAAGVGGGGALDFVATGTIANGDTVGVLSDGTVQTVTSFKSAQVTYDNVKANFNSAVYDTNSNKVVVVYSGDNNRVYGNVGTISNGEITFGAQLQISPSSQSFNVNAVFDTNSNKVVVVWRNGGAGSVQARVATVSGTTLSVGSATTVHTSVNAYNDISATFDTNSNKVVVFARETNNTQEAFVGTVSGTSISFGSPVVFESDAVYNLGSTFDSSNNKVILVYRRGSDDKSYAKVGTVSGTSISFGSRALFVGTGTGFYPVATFDSQNNKVVVAYRNSSDSGKGYASVGTVSGTSISFGTPVKFLDDNSITTDNMAIAFDLNSNAVRIFNCGIGTVTTGIVSGTSITFSDPQSGLQQGAELAVAYDSDTLSFVYANKRVGGTTADDGTAAVVDPASSFGGFIGIAAANISDNASGEVTVTGGVNEGQSGLSAGLTYYLQDNGSLNTTSSDVKVGVALSATKILIT